MDIKVINVFEASCIQDVSKLSCKIFSKFFYEYFVSDILIGSYDSSNAILLRYLLKVKFFNPLLQIIYMVTMQLS